MSTPQLDPDLMEIASGLSVDKQTGLADLFERWATQLRGNIEVGKTVIIAADTMEQGDTLRLPIKHPVSFKVTEPEVTALRAISRWLARSTGNQPASENAIASCVLVAALAHPREVIRWIQSAADYGQKEGVAVADVCAARVEACPEYRSKRMPT